MTKVEASYELTAPVTDALLEAIDRAHSVYGLQSVRLTNSMDGLLVGFDASRLLLDDVENALHRVGLAVKRKE